MEPTTCEVLRMMREDDMDVPEIAEALDLSERAVREILSLHGWDE